MADVPVITIPRVVYDVLVGQAQANAKTLTELLRQTRLDQRTTPRHVLLYRALTGANLMQAKRELDEWAGRG